MDTFLILISAAVILVLLGISVATLTIVAKIYKMHDVRNEDGEYAWMVPGKFMDMQASLTKMQAQMTASQEKMVEAITESINNNKQVGELLRSLTNATLSLHQKMNGPGNEN